MKRVNVMKMSVVALVLISLSFASCKKDKEEAPVAPKKKYAVEYVVNENVSSPIFKIVVTYNDKDGKPMNEMITSLPWKKTIEVEAPFTAKISGVYSVDATATVPEQVIVDKDVSLTVKEVGGSFSKMVEEGSKFTMPKDKFLEYIETHVINFSLEYEIQ